MENHRSLPVRLAVAYAVALIAIGLPLVAPQAQQLTPLDEGKAVYMGHCAGCHGFDGGGNGPAATGMTPAPTNFKTATPASLPDNTIQQAVLVGKPPVMRGYSTILTPSEINALVAYLRTLATAQ
jgi:mono/diheme cytochrome c family protein